MDYTILILVGPERIGQFPRAHPFGLRGLFSLFYVYKVGVPDISAGFSCFATVIPRERNHITHSLTGCVTRSRPARASPLYAIAPLICGGAGAGADCGQDPEVVGADDNDNDSVADVER